jgi:SAM-dependent methyltransferase
MKSARPDQSMDVHYWNRFARRYDQVVTDAFTHGRSDTLAMQVERFASTRRAAADFGCGPGKLLPFLAPRFARVYGYDFSDKLLEIARQRCAGLPNVELLQVDLARPVDHLPTVELALSLNAAIMPDSRLRLQFLRGMASRLKPGGHLILNVPSVESLLYSAFRETEWLRRKGHSNKMAESRTDVSCLTGPRLMAQGVLYRGGALTKHFLREELIVLIRDEMRLEVTDMLKMEYDWATDFEDDSVPDWMGDPYPWDWLVIARRPR